MIITVPILVCIVFKSQAQFAGGSDTEVDPYQISKVTQLQEYRHHLDKHFFQTTDIDASET